MIVRSDPCGPLGELGQLFVARSLLDLVAPDVRPLTLSRRGGERARLGRQGWRLANHVLTPGECPPFRELQRHIADRRGRRLAAPEAGARP